MNHFREMLSEIRGEDFEIVYLNPVNHWVQIVGNGLAERDVMEGGDLAHYLENTFKGDNLVGRSADQSGESITIKTCHLDYETYHVEFAS
jgi:hypothetical protein